MIDIFDSTLSLLYSWILKIYIHVFTDIALINVETMDSEIGLRKLE